MPAAKRRLAEGDGEDRRMQKVEGALGVTVLNRQRRFSIATGSVSEALKAAAAALGVDGGDVTVVLAPDSLMRSLNSRYRQQDWPTDVLAFAAAAGSEELGDVVIGVETAARQAREHGHALMDELKILVMHGFLHLLGHDHETDGGTMRRLELSLRRRVLGRTARIGRGSAMRRSRRRE
jgi:probable rRNA maturation factor